MATKYPPFPVALNDL